MKKIDDIIKNTVQQHLDEQRTAAKKTDAQLAISGTSVTNPWVSPVKQDELGLRPWPTSARATPWKNVMAELWLKSQLKAPAFRPAVDYSDAELASKNIKALYAWNHGKHETNLFYADGRMQALDANQTLYWNYNPGQYKYGTLHAVTVVGKPGHMGIYSDMNHKQLAYVIYIEKNGQPNIHYAKPTEVRTAAQKAAQEKAVWRNILDIVGWVPYIGDAVDLYQFCWYMSDYKYHGHKKEDLWNALFSLIAVVPYAGSFAALGFKKAFRGIKSMMAAEKATNFKEFFANLTPTGRITDKAKNEFASMLVEFSKKFGSIKNWITDKAAKHGFDGTLDFLVTLEKEVAEGANDARQYLYNLEKRVGKSTGSTLKAKEALKNSALDPSQLAIAKKALNASNWSRFNSVWTSLVYGYGRNGDAKAFVESLFQALPTNEGAIRKLIPNIKQLLARAAWVISVGKGRREAIVKSIKNSFIKAVAADRDKLALMIFHAKNAPGVEVSKILKLASRIPVDLKRIESEELLRLFKSKVKTIMMPGPDKYIMRGKQKIKQAGDLIPRDISRMGMAEINDLLDRGGTFTIDVVDNIMEDVVKYLHNITIDEYNGIVTNAVNEMIAFNNPLWREVLIDPVRAAAAYFPKSAKEFWDHMKGSIFDVKKNLRSIYQFYNEAMEDLGFKAEDDISTSASYEAFLKLLNNVNWDKDTTDKFNNYRAINKANMDKIKGYVGIQDRRTDPNTITAGDVHPDSTYVTPETKRAMDRNRARGL